MKYLFRIREITIQIRCYFKKENALFSKKTLAILRKNSKFGRTYRISRNHLNENKILVNNSTAA